MKRDREFVSRKYEQIWGGVRDFVQSLRAAGIADFESVFRHTLEFTNGLPPAAQRSVELAQEVEFSFHGVEVRMDLMAREYLWRDMVSSAVLSASCEPADVIAELGSGWSANIFNLWLRGAPKNATYFGGELTEGGRQAASAVAHTRPQTSYLAPAFDWSYPDFSFIPRGARNVTLYSCYSIEQIPQLGADAIRDLLRHTSSAQSVQGVFIEPVGWQYPEHSPDPALVERSRRYAHEKNYNVNLRQVMETLAMERRIRITRVDVDSFGSMTNPATSIHWQRT